MEVKSIHVHSRIVVLNIEDIGPLERPISLVVGVVVIIVEVEALRQLGRKSDPRPSRSARHAPQTSKVHREHMAVYFTVLRVHSACQSLGGTVGWL